MTKIKLSPHEDTFSKPIVLVGANIDEHANFMNVAWFNRLNRTRNLWGACIGKTKLTLEGIIQNNTFSVNLPDVSQAQIVDYCDLHSGRDVDKAALFDVFYGNLKTAPMIRECPVNAELSVYKTLELPTHTLVIGEVKHIYTEEQSVTEGEVDQKKLNPFVFTRPQLKPRLARLKQKLVVQLAPQFPQLRMFPSHFQMLLSRL